MEAKDGNSQSRSSNDHICVHIQINAKSGVRATNYKGHCCWMLNYYWACDMRLGLLSHSHTVGKIYSACKVGAYKKDLKWSAVVPVCCRHSGYIHLATEYSMFEASALHCSSSLIQLSLSHTTIIIWLALYNTYLDECWLHLCRVGHRSIHHS